MFDIVLYRPEIPPNTGNVIRLADNTGARLHLVEPLGFSMDDRQLKRAGLDYHELAGVRVHPDWQSCLKVLNRERLFALTTRAEKNVYDTRFQANDAFVFGSETKGLDQEFLSRLPQDRQLRLPMLPGNRSLNLSNAVAVTVFEAWRQLSFPGGR